ncbi:uncharacterized protein EV420DRAFT_1501262 [Desarmillaria tabescens]|uniref:Uncharacterized protein n=1 Tax=Armillaria tabescens TaxID=1929756 RepID=A0AA39NLI1_ARMTA|nr:uncharacterized protein EV420DRAFT_1501262 [Desarmillaria tabescens]KAK0467780.1 hypothetical protein EV420DRAFT_1501262 [Desarmillaria tabescens]
MYFFLLYTSLFSLLAASVAFPVSLISKPSVFSRPHQTSSVCNFRYRMQTMICGGPATEQEPGNLSVFTPVYHPLPMIGIHGVHRDITYQFSLQLPTLESPTSSDTSPPGVNSMPSKKRLVIIVATIGLAVFATGMILLWHYRGQLIALRIFTGCRDFLRRVWSSIKTTCGRCWTRGCDKCSSVWKTSTKCWISFWAIVLPYPAIFKFFEGLEGQFTPCQLAIYRIGPVVNLGILILSPCAIALDHGWQTIVVAIVSSTYYALRMVRDDVKSRDSVSAAAADGATGHYYCRLIEARFVLAYSMCFKGIRTTTSPNPTPLSAKPDYPRELFTSKKDLLAILLTCVVAVTFIAGYVMGSIHYPRECLLLSASVANSVLNVFTDIMVPQFIAECIIWEVQHHQFNYSPQPSQSQSQLRMKDQAPEWFLETAKGYRSNGWQWRIPESWKDTAVLTQMLECIRSLRKPASESQTPGPQQPQQGQAGRTTLFFVLTLSFLF